MLYSAVDLKCNVICYTLSSSLVFVVQCNVCSGSGEA